MADLMSFERAASVLLPRMSFSVSVMSSMPDLMMKSAMRSPSQASRLIPVAVKNMADARTDAEIMAS